MEARVRPSGGQIHPVSEPQVADVNFVLPGSLPEPTSSLTALPGQHSVPSPVPSTSAIPQTTFVSSHATDNDSRGVSEPSVDSGPQPNGAEASFTSQRSESLAEELLQPDNSTVEEVLVLTPSRLRLDSRVVFAHATLRWLTNAIWAVLIWKKLDGALADWSWWAVFGPAIIGHLLHIPLQMLVLLTAPKFVYKQIGPPPPPTASPGIVVQYSLLLHVRLRSHRVDWTNSLLESVALFAAKLQFCDALNRGALSDTPLRLMFTPIWACWVLSFALLCLKDRSERMFGSSRDLLFAFLLFVAFKVDNQSSYSWRVVFLIPWMWFSGVQLVAAIVFLLLMFARVWSRVRDLLLPLGFLALLVACLPQFLSYIALVRRLDGDTDTTIQSILLPNALSWLAMWLAALLLCSALAAKEAVRDRLLARGAVWTAHEGWARRLTAVREEAVRRVDELKEEEVSRLVEDMMAGKVKPGRLRRVGENLYRRMASLEAAVAEQEAQAALQAVGAQGLTQREAPDGPQQDGGEGEGQAAALAPSATTPDGDTTPHPPPPTTISNNNTAKVKGASAATSSMAYDSDAVGGKEQGAAGDVELVRVVAGEEQVAEGWCGVERGEGSFFPRAAPSISYSQSSPTPQPQLLNPATSHPTTPRRQRTPPELPAAPPSPPSASPMPRAATTINTNTHTTNTTNTTNNATNNASNTNTNNINNASSGNSFNSSHSGATGPPKSPDASGRPSPRVPVHSSNWPRPVPISAATAAAPATGSAAGTGQAPSKTLTPDSGVRNSGSSSGVLSASSCRAGRDGGEESFGMGPEEGGEDVSTAVREAEGRLPAGVLPPQATATGAVATAAAGTSCGSLTWRPPPPPLPLSQHGGVKLPSLTGLPVVSDGEGCSGRQEEVEESCVVMQREGRPLLPPAAAARAPAVLLPAAAEGGTEGLRCEVSTAAGSAAAAAAVSGKTRTVPHLDGAGCEHPAAAIARAAAAAVALSGAGLPSSSTEAAVVCSTALSSAPESASANTATATATAQDSLPDTASGEDDSEKSCMICFDQRPSCVFLECGHGGFCRRCAFLLFVRPPNECPICRTLINQVVEIEDGSKVGEVARVK